MPDHKRDHRCRLALARLMIEVLRPVPADSEFNLNDRLVAYCVVVSSFGPIRMGVDKITGLCGLPRSTVRSSLKRLVASGKVLRLREGYVIEPGFSQSAAREMELDRKIGCIVAAAKEIEAASGRKRPARAMDRAKVPSQVWDKNEQIGSGESNVGRGIGRKA